MFQLALKIRRKARNTPLNILFLALAVVRLHLLLKWRLVDAFFHRQATYRHEGITLKFKITSDVELLRVRNKGQAFILHEFLGRLSPGDVYYDIGGNIGIHALPAAVMVGEKGLVVAFEPDAANYSRLLENAETNNLNNVIAFGVALGAVNQISSFYRHTNRVGEGGHSLIKRDEQKGGISRVPQTRLDDLMVLWGLPIPQFVKIDVEGTELDVLNGMRKVLDDDQLHTIVCEVSGPDPKKEASIGTEKAVSDMLARFGFAEIGRCGTGSAGIFMDILFVKSDAPHSVYAMNDRTIKENTKNEDAIPS